MSSTVAEVDSQGGARRRHRHRHHRDEEQEEEVEELFSFSQWLADVDKRKLVTVALLVFVNLINYMDRAALPGMMERIKRDPSFMVKSNQVLGLLGTSFVISYMVFAPIFGYLGDRYNRIVILALGISCWSLATFLGSLVHSFYLFVFFRSLVGVGEASYSAVAPSILADLFSGDARSQMLALFFFAIPVGSGLGYVVCSGVAELADNWRWGLRVTPVLGAISVAIILLWVRDPPRGLSDGISDEEHLNRASKSIWPDLKELVRNRSFVLSCLGFTCITFNTGAFALWGPEFGYYGWKASCGNTVNCDAVTLAAVSLRFGIIMSVSGLVGVPLGSYIAQVARRRMPEADAVVCGASLLFGVPFVWLGFYYGRFDINLSFSFAFIAILVVSFCWSIVSDMTLYIVKANQRSLASALQILLSHALGDAISPFLIGLVADNVHTERPPHLPPGEEDYDSEFRGLQYGLFMCPFILAMGSFFFFEMSFSLLRDKEVAELHNQQGAQAEREPQEEDEE